MLWLLLGVCGQVAAAVARGGDAARELRLRRRLQPWLAARHLAFGILLFTGVLLMRERGLAPARAPWLALKLGLVAFLVFPLEAMHAYVAHGWIAKGLRASARPPFAKDLARGLGIEEMLRTLSVPLLGAGLPLIVWLSLRKPF